MTNLIKVAKARMSKRRPERKARQTHFESNVPSDASKSIDTNIDRLERLGRSLAVDDVHKLWLERSTAD